MNIEHEYETRPWITNREAWITFWVSLIVFTALCMAGTLMIGFRGWSLVPATVVCLAIGAYMGMCTVLSFANRE